MSDFEFRPSRRPNVIWVFGDQLRVQALGYRGNRNAYTPNIDDLARNGMRFDSAVAGAPWCSPFRAAMLTGVYPHQCGVPRTPSALDPAVPTVAHAFAGAGYHTAYVGKWHVDGSNHREHYVPPERRGGFDYWMGFENNNNQNECYVHGSDSEVPIRLGGYESDALTDLFLGHVRGHVTDAGDDYRPFFAVLSVQPPHNPYVAPSNPPYPVRTPRPADVVLRANVPQIARVREQASLDLAGYYAMIQNIDYNVGRIRQELRSLGIDRETYVVFFSDHGDMLGSHGQLGKSSPWEEAIRIPFVISKVGGGDNMRIGRTDAPLNHVDIAPTTLGLCGIGRPDGMVGHDYSGHCVRRDAPEFRGRPSAADEPNSAYLQQIPRKMHPHSVNKAWRGVLMRDGWKYVCMPGHDWLLFNTREDPCEQANLAHDRVYQQQKERCHRRLARWVDDTGDAFDLPDIALP